jgi:hypothetical protein
MLEFLLCQTIKIPACWKHFVFVRLRMNLSADVSIRILNVFEQSVTTDVASGPRRTEAFGVVSTLK